MRKLLSIIWHFFVETISLPGLIKQILKYIAASLDFVVSFGKAILVAILADPLIFILTAGVLLWMYLDDFLAEFG